MLYAAILNSVLEQGRFCSWNIPTLTQFDLFFCPRRTILAKSRDLYAVSRAREFSIFIVAFAHLDLIGQDSLHFFSQLECSTYLWLQV